jgi:CHAT domain-containing protein
VFRKLSALLLVAWLAFCPGSPAGAPVGFGQIPDSSAVTKRQLENRKVRDQGNEQTLGTDGFFVGVNELAAALDESRGDYAAARKARKLVLDARIRLYGEKDWSVADSRAALAHVERLAGLKPDQLQKLAEVKELLRKADALQRQGQFRQALQAARQAWERRRELLGAEDPDSIGALKELGMLAQEQGDYSEAEKSLKEACELRKKSLGEDNPATSASLYLLSGLYRAWGDDARAEQVELQAIQIDQKLHAEDSPYYAQAVSRLAEAARKQGDFDEAERRYRQYGELARKNFLSNLAGVMADAYAASLTARATLRQLQGDDAGAEKLLGEALEHREKGGLKESVLYAANLHLLGLLHLSRGDYQKAEPLLLRALALREKLQGKASASIAQSLTSLAILYKATDRPADALAAVEKALQIDQHNLQYVFGFSAEPDMRRQLAATEGHFHILLNMAAAPGHGAAAERTALNWVLRRKGIILDTVCRFQEVQYLLRQDEGVARRVVELRRLRQQLADSALQSPPKKEEDKSQKQRQDWRQQADRLESELHRSLAQRRPEQDASPADVDQVRRRLPDGSALVEFVRAYRFDFHAKGKKPFWQPEHYLAWVLTAGKEPPRLVDLGDADAIDREVAALRQEIDRSPGKLRKGGLEPDMEEEFRKRAGALYRRLFAPLGDALGKSTRVYLAPDGELNRMPFEALVDDRDRYLIETYRFAYLTSGRDLLRPGADPGRGTVVFAGPDYDLKAVRRQEGSKELGYAAPEPAGVVLRGAPAAELLQRRWPPLPGAVAEAKDVRQALQGSDYAPVRTYEGPAALEEVFKGLSGHAPRVLHVATHGFFLPDETNDPPTASDLEVGFGAGAGQARLRHRKNPLLRSGLVLAGANNLGKETASGVEDGWVTAEEIALLDLRGTELVVLSACETGLGDVKAGEGVYGLRRAFLYTGARRLVTSLFSVPDRETRQLMRSFYGNLKAGKDELDALREAQLAIIERRRKENDAALPFFWAGFIVVGNPR